MIETSIPKTNEATTANGIGNFQLPVLFVVVENAADRI